MTLFQHPELEQQVRGHGLEFFPIEIPYLAVPKKKRMKTGHNAGPSIGEIRDRLDRVHGEMGAFLMEYPAAIRAAGVDTLIMGEITLAGPTVAEMLRLPYFIVSISVPHNFGWEAPQSIAPSRSWRERLEKHLLQVSVLRMRGPIRRGLDRYRKQLGLGSIRRIEKTFPELAHITQWPQCLDIPRSGLLANFFYTGPFVDGAGRPPVKFPWERLDGRPLIYASLGTTRKGDSAIFYRIAEACSGLDLQLVISLGGRRDPALFTGLPGNPILVANAPQLELLQRATIVITHAGPNTALETLMQGKPMLALPIALDQPAIAAHLARLGAAEVLSPEACSAQQIRTALVNLLENSSYRETAQKLQTQIRSGCGLNCAADIIEAALAKHHAEACNDAPLEYAR